MSVLIKRVRSYRPVWFVLFLTVVIPFVAHFTGLDHSAVLSWTAGIGGPIGSAIWRMRIR